MMALGNEIITSVISRCKVSSIKETVVRWGRLGTSQMKNQIFEGTKREIAERVARLVQQKQGLSDEIIGDLELAYIQLHSKSKLWIVYKLTGTDLHLNLDPRALRSKVVQCLQLKWKEGYVYGNMRLFAGAVWLRFHMCRSTATRRQAGHGNSGGHRKLYNHNNSVFVITFPDSPYVIVSRAGVRHTRVVTEAITDVMNGEKLKDIQLSGRHVASLADLALRKDGGTLSSWYRDQEETENPLLVKRDRKRKAVTEVEDTEEMVDENREEKRARMAELERKFGEDQQPVLERLEYKFNLKFNGHRASDGDCKSSVEMKGTSVLEGLCQMAEKGLVKFPLPKHLTSALSSARNRFSIESKKK